MSSSIAIDRGRRGGRLVALTTSLLFLGPLLAAAEPPPDGPPGGGAAPDHRGPAERAPADHAGRDHPGWGHEEWGPGPAGWQAGPDAEWSLHPRFLRGVKLTDDQQDRIFAIEHAAAPALREQAKAMRKAHESLRDIGTAATYDEARVRSLTEAAGRAAAQLMLLRIRGEHDIYAVLTPEQRTEIAVRRQPWQGRDHERGPPGD